MYQIAQILAQIYTKITIFRENLRHFGANFGKFWNVDTIKVPNFTNIRDPLKYLAA